MIKLYGEGVKNKDIADIMKVPVRHINYVVQKSGASKPCQKYDDADVAKVRELREAGKTMAEIATALGLTGSAVGYLLTSNGIKLTHEQRSRAQQKWSPEDKAKVLELRASGMKLKSIAEVMGIPLGTVKKIAAGISF